jgi:hypothetical protein
MDNYEFCARFAGDAVPTTGGSILISDVARARLLENFVSGSLMLTDATIFFDPHLECFC